jgi:hypothetical protein
MSSRYQIVTDLREADALWEAGLLYVQPVDDGVLQEWGWAADSSTQSPSAWVQERGARLLGNWFVKSAFDGRVYNTAFAHLVED